MATAYLAHSAVVTILTNIKYTGYQATGTDPARLDRHDRLAGPGSGTTIVSTETGLPLLRETPPLTFCDMSSFREVQGKCSEK